MMLTGEELDADEAYRLGVVHRLVPSDQIWVRSSSWGEKLAESAAESLQLSKKLLNEMIGEQLSTNLASGAAATATSLTTEAASEGLKAFNEKRAPSFHDVSWIELCIKTIFCPSIFCQTRPD